MVERLGLSLDGYVGCLVSREIYKGEAISVEFVSEDEVSGWCLIGGEVIPTCEGRNGGGK